MIDGIDLDEMDLGELPELERRDDGSVDTVDDEMDLGGMPELEHRDDQSEFEFEGEEDDGGSSMIAIAKKRSSFMIAMVVIIASTLRGNGLIKMTWI
jgi:hypothetical protein